LCYGLDKFNLVLGGKQVALLKAKVLASNYHSVRIGFGFSGGRVENEVSELLVHEDICFDTDELMRRANEHGQKRATALTVQYVGATIV
jgi:hypothetical protein